MGLGLAFDEEGNSWIQFDFQDQPVRLTHYTLKCDGSSHHLQHWSMLGLDDGMLWTTLDRRTTSDLASSYAMKTFACPHGENPTSFHFVRRIRTGKNSGGTTHLMLSSVEFFGTLKTQANKS
jgi:hypothetical protein